MRRDGEGFLRVAVGFSAHLIRLGFYARYEFERRK